MDVVGGLTDLDEAAGRELLDAAAESGAVRAQVVSGAAEPWVARRVAGMTRRLGAGCVGVVDRAVARAIGGHAPSTVLEVAAAKVIEADPETHAMERERERHARYWRR